MKKLFFLWILFMLFVFSVFAIDCQYTEEEEYQKVEKHFFNTTNNIDLDIAVEEFDFIGQSFKVKNILDYKINLKVSYKIYYSGAIGTRLSFRSYSKTIELNPNEIFQFKESYDCGPLCKGYHIKDDSVVLKIIFPQAIERRIVNVNDKIVICKLCKDVQCLDDGQSCTSPIECGGGFCVEGYCSNTEYCFNNECKCNSDEIQCSNNKQCVQKKVVPLDVKPKCDLNEECVSGYFSLESGLCAKSPAQIQEEENQKLKKELALKEKEKRFLINAILGFAFIVIFGIGTIWYLKNKHEKEKQKTIETKTNSDIKVEEARQKTIQKEIELEGRKIQRKEYELNELKEQIKEIERQKNKTQQEIKELKNLKSKREDLIVDIENQYDKITKPFPDPQASNRLVVINPHLGGYKCFYDKKLHLIDYPTSKLLHRWVWKKHNGRYPRQGYHIHHVDEDKYNNDPKNLEEIEGTEHYSLHSAI